MRIAVLIVVVAVAFTGCAMVDTVRITSDSIISLNGTEMPIKSLSDSFKKKSVLIMASPYAANSTLLQVLDEVDQAGIDKVKVNTKN